MPRSTREPAKGAGKGAARGTAPYRPPPHAGDQELPRVERRRLTHLDRTGRPRMVDVSDKPATARRAVAEALVRMGQETLSAVIDGAGPKGDVLSVAELAGIMAAKRTADLIPLCHPLPLTDVGVEIAPDRRAGGLRITARAATTAPTGVEMEALTAAAVAALTVYDMVKSADREVSIEALRLLEKSGGRSGAWRRRPEARDEGSATPQATPRVRRARPPRRGG